MEIQRSPAKRPETGKEAGRLAKRINLVWAGAEILACGDQRTLADFPGLTTPSTSDSAMMHPLKL